MKFPLISVSLLAMASAPAFSAPNQAPKPWQLNVYGVEMADGDLQQDGEFSDSSIGGELAYRTRINNKLMLSTNASFDNRYTDFAQEQLFNGELAAFEERTRLGLGVTALYMLNPSWTVLVAPRLQWAAADNASLSDSDSYGFMAGGMYNMSRSLQFGFGVAYSNDIDKTTTAVIPMIRWQINDKLKLDNPFDPSFAGRAGLELSYRWNPHFELGFGGAYRSERFAVEDGAMEIVEPIAFSRLSYFPSQSWSVTALIGYRAEGEMMWEKNDIEETQDLDARLGFGLNFGFKF